jgi:hypothetical protein
MGQIKPLAKFPIIATNSVEEAEVALSRSLTDVKNKLTASEAKFITCDMKMIPQLNWGILKLG